MLPVLQEQFLISGSKKKQAKRGRTMRIGRATIFIPDRGDIEMDDTSKHKKIKIYKRRVRTIHPYPESREKDYDSDDVLEQLNLLDMF